MYISLCLYLYVYISMFITLCLYLYVSISMCLSLCVYLYVSISMCLSLCVYLNVSISMCMLRSRTRMWLPLTWKSLEVLLQENDIRSKGLRVGTNESVLTTFLASKSFKILQKFSCSCVTVFLKNGPNPASFCLFSSFSQHKYNTNFTIKSVDGVLGICTQGGRMVGAEESTELWRHPKSCDTLTYVSKFYSLTNFQ